jgi:hypothetical protein
LWSDQVYKEVVNDKYLINFHGAQTNVHLSIDQFMQLTHEVKVCHGDYLVNHLPHCVWDRRLAASLKDYWIWVQSMYLGSNHSTFGFLFRV